jgi:hypothetical protein
MSRSGPGDLTFVSSGSLFDSRSPNPSQLRERFPGSPCASHPIEDTSFTTRPCLYSNIRHVEIGSRRPDVSRRLEPISDRPAEEKLVSSGSLFDSRSPNPSQLRERFPGSPHVHASTPISGMSRSGPGDLTLADVSSRSRTACSCGPYCVLTSNHFPTDQPKRSL